MKYIELTQGMRVMVDDDLYDWLNQWKWYYHKRSGGRKGGDAVRTLHGYDENGLVKNQMLYMYSMILPIPPGRMVDHQDLNPLNNQRDNLRLASHRGNTLNSGVRSTNKVGIKSICWHHATQRYRVQLSIGRGKRVSKAFIELKDAVAWRNKMFKEYRSKFDRLD